eukprot:7756741-Karenia_brevis.AAC.1
MQLQCGRLNHGCFQEIFEALNCGDDVGRPPVRLGDAPMKSCKQQIYRNGILFPRYTRVSPSLPIMSPGFLSTAFETRHSTVLPPPAENLLHVLLNGFLFVCRQPAGTCSKSLRLPLAHQEVTKVSQ